MFIQQSIEQLSSAVVTNGNSIIKIIELINKQTSKTMTKDELFELWKKMKKQRVDDGLPPPFEPSPIEFAARVAEISYERGYEQGAIDNGGYF